MKTPNVIKTFVLVVGYMPCRRRSARKFAGMVLKSQGYILFSGTDIFYFENRNKKKYCLIRIE